MAPVALEALRAAGVAPADLDAFIPHQANLRIIERSSRSSASRPDVLVARDIVETGNTSAASIPLALERMLERGEVEDRRHGAADRLRRRARLRRAGRPLP